MLGGKLARGPPGPIIDIDIPEFDDRRAIKYLVAEPIRRLVHVDRADHDQIRRIGDPPRDLVSAIAVGMQFDVATGDVRMCGAIAEIDETTGKAISMERVEVQGESVDPAYDADDKSNWQGGGGGGE